jgi:heme oxygenase
MEKPMVAMRLKAETLQSHEDLEKHPNLIAMGEGEMTLDGYADILRRFYPFWEAVEQSAYNFEGVKSVLPDIEDRKLSANLLADLKALNVEPAPSYHGINWVTDLASAMGTIYVIEGSTLGGRVIVKRVMEQLKLTPQNGCSYYFGYGAETGAKWKGFMDGLAACNFSDAEADQVVAAATKTFDALNAWMGADLNKLAA